MSEININTTAVEQAAILLSEYNNSMQNKFSTVKQIMKKVSNNWIHRKYLDDASTSRYSMMQQNIKFLKDYIAPGYVQTEKTNLSLADRFK